MDPKPLLEFEAFSDFRQVTNRDVYHPLPDDWFIGVTDVVGSTKAVEAGRYKAVNMAGASVITAVMNALDRLDFPFSFGGDGAQVAVPPDYADMAREVMAKTATWSAESLGLELRVALVPIADIRAAGHDVLVAQYAPSPSVRYAMFSGGGVEWAEDMLKARTYAIEPAAAGNHADLTGLSCRWKPIKTRAGVMLSLIVRQAPGVQREQFFNALQSILEFIEAEPRDTNPLPSNGPEFGSPVAGLGLEARIVYGTVMPLLAMLRLLPWRVFAWVIVTFGISVGGFSPKRYRAETVQNSDFRKFHDGLDMTIDCTPEQVDRIEAILRGMEAEGVIRYGIFRQSEALMTCIVPSYSSDNHLHFIDGGQGGYTAAARRLKAMKI